MTFLLVSDNAAFVGGESDTALTPAVPRRRLQKWLVPLFWLVPVYLLAIAVAILIQLVTYNPVTATISWGLFALMFSVMVGVALVYIGFGLRLRHLWHHPTTPLDLNRLEKRKRSNRQHLYTGYVEAIEVRPLAENGEHSDLIAARAKDRASLTFTDIAILNRTPAQWAALPDTLEVALTYRFATAPAEELVTGRQIFRVEGRELEDLMTRGMVQGATVQVLYQDDEHHWLL